MIPEGFTLRQVGPHAYAYSAGKVGMAEPLFCANCLEKGERSILQFECHEIDADVLRCHACKGAVRSAVDRGSLVRSHHGDGVQYSRA